MNIRVLLLIAVFLFPPSICAENKKASTVFRKWFDTQEIFSDKTITDQKNTLNNEFILIFKKRYEQFLPALTLTTPFLRVLTNNLIRTEGYYFKPPIDQTMKDNFVAIYDMLENNIPAFVECLKGNNFISQELIASEDLMTRDTATNNLTLIIERNILFMRLLCAHDSIQQEQELLTAVANRFFEYCFSPQTFPHFQGLLLDHTAHPVVRLLFSVMWQQFVGSGWKDWHASSLKNLKQKADLGHQIVYVAGGTDLLALISNGIYNIHIIDPFLPTQTKYYSEDWQFLIKNTQSIGIDDEIHFGSVYKNIFMRRTGYYEGENFCLKLSDNTLAEIRQSTTTWTVFDAQNKTLGTVTIDRRLANNQDFLPAEKKTLLMAYNEFVCAAAPGLADGWNINIASLPADIEIIVKQLRKPINKDILGALRLTSLVNFSEIKFINFSANPQ